METRRALSDDDVAWLGLLLVNITVRDHAWERVGEDLPLHVDLWSDVVRRVEPELVAPPATLLAFAAWRSGGGAIASIALERAIEADPTYRMAVYLSAAFDGGLSPELYDRDPVGAGVDVHRRAAQEADDRHAGLGGQLDRE